MAVCVPKMMDEGKPQDQATAACMNMWQMKMDAAKFHALSSAVKAVGDWELDVLAIPFYGTDADKQYFDDNTDIMPEAFQTPLIVYQHGIEQGAKNVQAKPLVIGKAVQGTLKKEADGWHIRVILDKAIKQAKDIMDAAYKGLVAVSTGSINHLARLDVGGKLMQYEKNRPGRIAVWALGEISLWELGNGNFKPASRFATALPVMKAIYRDAGLVFPEIKDTTGASPEAEKAAKRAEIVNRAKKILAKNSTR